MSDFIDRSGPIRKGEELDLAKLETYLLANIPHLTGPLVAEQFPSGFSNLTYRLRMGQTEMVLRRPPFGSKVKSAHDMGREYRVLSKLSDVYPPAPRPLHYFPDDSVLGAPFSVMQRIRGIILRATPPPELQLTPAQARDLCESFIENLALLHSIDYQAAGLGDLGKPEGYVQRQVTGWTKRYYRSQTDDIPEIEAIIARIAERVPPESGAVLLHNDYKFDNITLDPDNITRLIGVLDWEMSTIGDPLTDLGTSLAYWAHPDAEVGMNNVTSGAA